MPPWSSPKPELARRAEHAVRPLAPQLAALDLHAVRHHRAERGQRHEVADRHVERAAADLRAARRRRRRRRRSWILSASGCGRSVEHLRDDDAVEALADAVDRPRPPCRGRSSASPSASGSPSTGANSWSQESRTFIARSELLQEADVVGEQLAEVVDAVAHERRGGRCRSRTRSPDHSSGSMPQLRNTLGWTMPQPPSSSHEPSGRWMSNSADGSVNGKYDGPQPRARSRAPKKALVNASIVPARSAKVMPRSMTRPSIWWNTGMWVASAVSCRNTRPGHDRVDRRLAAPASPGSAPARCACAARTLPGSPRST